MFTNYRAAFEAKYLQTFIDAMVADARHLPSLCEQQ